MVRVHHLQLGSEVLLHLCSSCNLVLWLLVELVVISKRIDLMILARDQLCDCPASSVHISSLMAGEQRSADQRLANISNGFITELVRIGCCRSLALRQNQTFRVPCPTIEALGSNVLIELELDGIVLQVLVADQQHAVNMVAVFVVFWVDAKQRYGCSHLQEAVAEKLKSLVILAHASLEIDLLATMVFSVIGVFSHGFQGQVRTDFEMKKVASL